MTIDAPIAKRHNFTGNDVATSFSYTKKITDQDHIKLVHTDTAGLENALADPLVVDVDYTVNGVGDAGGGSVDFPKAGSVYSTLATGEKLSIIYDFPTEQQLDVPNTGRVFNVAVENQLDYITNLISQDGELLDRALKLPEGSTLTDIVFPEGISASNRSLKIAQWDTDGTALQLASIGSATTIDPIVSKGDMVQGDSNGDAAKLAIGGDKEVLVVSTDELAYSGLSLTVDIANKRIGINKANPDLAIDVVVATGVEDGLNIKSGGTGNAARLVANTGDDGQLELIESTGTVIVKLIGAAGNDCYIGGDAGQAGPGLGLGKTVPGARLHMIEDASDNWMYLEKSSGGTIFRFEYDSNANMGSVPMLRIDNDQSPEIALYIADVAGGTRLHLWDDAVVLPVNPHTGIISALNVHGDLLVGDISTFSPSGNSYIVGDRTTTHISVTAGLTQYRCSKANAGTDLNGGAEANFYPIMDIWKASTVFTVGAQCITVAGAVTEYFTCTTAGTSGASEPSWDLGDGNTTADGTVVWTTEVDSFNDGINETFAYGRGDGTLANNIIFTTRSGANAVTRRVFIKEGMQVGTPTGGDKGAGTINVATDIYKNNTVYTDPDYVFEHFYTGGIEKYKDNEGSKGYLGLDTIDSVERYVKDNWRLPRVSDSPVGIFERGDIALSHIEELYLHLFEINNRINKLEKGGKGNGT